MRQVLGDFMTDNAYDVDESLENVPNALNKLTGPTYSLGDIIRYEVYSNKNTSEGLDKWLRRRAPVLKVRGLNPAMTW